jgi:hypothetical protein
MIVINTDGAFDVVPYNDGVLVRTHHTECLRKMMTRIHGKKWVYAHLADHIKHTPKTRWKWRMTLHTHDWTGYLGKCTRAMDYDFLYDKMITEEDITTTKLHGIAGVYTHMKKGWSHVKQV